HGERLVELLGGCERLCGTAGDLLHDRTGNGTDDHSVALIEASALAHLRCLLALVDDTADRSGEVGSMLRQRIRVDFNAVTHSAVLHTATSRPGRGTWSRSRRRARSPSPRPCSGLPARWPSGR